MKKFLIDLRPKRLNRVLSINGYDDRLRGMIRPRFQDFLGDAQNTTKRKQPFSKQTFCKHSIFQTIFEAISLHQ